MTLPVFSIVAQTVNSLWVDGRIYLKISDNAAFNFQEHNGKINPAEVYFLEGLVERYGITEMINPFKSAKSDVLQRTFRLDFENISEINNLIRDLSQNPAIEYAEPAPLFFISLTPNDPYYNASLSGGVWGSANSSWHLNLINADEAWMLLLEILI
jgi:hypothetical protein